jgi:hypothetical protein
MSSAHLSGRWRPPADAVEEIDPCIAVHVPCRHVRKAQAHGDAMTHRARLGAHGFQRAHGTAELHGEAAFLRLGETLAVVREGEGPAADLESRGDRQRGLHEGAAHHRRRGVLARFRGEAAHRAFEAAVRFLEAGPEAERHGGIEHVLAGRAEMRMPGRIPRRFRDLRAQHLDQRHGEGGRALAFGHQLRLVGDQRIAGGHDGGGARLGDQAFLGLRARERRLEGEHGAAEGRRRESRFEGRPGERAGGEGCGHRASGREEDGFALALQAHFPAVLRAAGGRGDERVQARRRSERLHLRIRARLLTGGEVDARAQRLQQAPREDGDVDEGRVAFGHRGLDAERAVLRRLDAPEA